jgi:hypothetical protein
MHRLALILSAAALAACNSQVPDSAAGVGFGDYESYAVEQIAREQQLAGVRPLVPGGPVIAQETLGATDGRIAAAPGTGDPLSATGAPATPFGNNPGLSDEQDFAAVSARETIESDAARLERLRAEYQVIQPEALPTRPGNTGPNIVAFALNTTNAVGQPLYRRSGFNAESRFQRACARYTSADEAQRDFLARGGPENDRLGVDPDGDGFACFWDPRPFRAARGG